MYVGVIWQKKCLKKVPYLYKVFPNLVIGLVSVLTNALASKLSIRTFSKDFFGHCAEEFRILSKKISAEL